MDIVIYTRRISEYIERKDFKRFGSKSTEIYNSREIFDELKKKTWQRKQWGNKDDGMKDSRAGK